MRNIFVLVYFLCIWMIVPTSLQAEVVYDPGTYMKTVNCWKRAIKDFPYQNVSFVKRFGSNGGRDRFHINKSRDTIIFIPGNLKADKEIKLVYWFHGLEGFSQRTFEKRLLVQFEKLMKSDTNFLVVIPEMPWSRNTTTPRGRQGLIWSGRYHDDFVRFYNESISFVRYILLDKMGVETPKFKVVLVGHSAGGSAIKSAAISGSLNEVKPDIVVFSDAGYGNWTKHTWENYVKDCGTCHFFVLARFGDDPYRNAERLFKTIGNYDRKIKFFVFDRFSYSHRKIGDNALLLAPIFETQ